VPVDCGAAASGAASKVDSPGDRVSPEVNEIPPPAALVGKGATGAVVQRGKIIGRSAVLSNGIRSRGRRDRGAVFGGVQSAS
jgi:hypothetical protein